ncbi:uncharacterized protein LOC100179383 isoform X2 [Ciona intestinalis]
MNTSNSQMIMNESKDDKQRNKGRRELFGLTQAIREKAFQSTFPTSENSQQQKNEQSTPNKSVKGNSRPTIEERLRNLFNSDAEGPEEIKSKSTTRGPASRLKSKRSASSAGPVQRQASLKIEQHAKNGSDQMPQQKLAPIQYSAHQVHANVIQHKLHSNQTQVPESQVISPARRCKSAVPSSFYDDAQQPVWERKSVSRSRDSSFEQQKETADMKNRSAFELDRNRNYFDNTRTRPVMTRSLCLYPETKENRKSINLPAHVANAATISTPQQTSMLHSTPKNNRNSRHFIKPSQEVSILGENLNHVPAQQPNKQTNTRRCITPSPGLQKHYLEVSAPKNCFSVEKKNEKLETHTPVAGPPKPQAHTPTRDYYPQQNFSFRRAVHHSVSSISDAGILDARLPYSAVVEKGQRKSDDRDSGTVLEGEASILDFNSSLLSEDDDICDVNKNTLKNSSFVSRSSTPTLPPLSPDEDENHDVFRPHFNLPGKPTTPVNAARTSVSSSKKTKSGGSVKSDENKLSVSSGHSINNNKSNDWKIESTKTPIKVVSSKVTKRSLASARPPLSANQRQMKDKQNRRFVDSDATEESQQRILYHAQARTHIFRHSFANADRTDVETSSVRSLTTTSVCSSSIMRRSGNRRHLRKRMTDDKYSREIRSVSKRFSRLESHVVTLARSLAQLSSELRQQNVTSREIEQLRHQVQEIRTRQLSTDMIEAKPTKCITPAPAKEKNLPKMSKLAKFFGERPPLLKLFLKKLGYEKYIRNFESESIGMMELPYMDEKRLRDIGIPLGPRLRILKEAQKSSYV